VKNYFQILEKVLIRVSELLGIGKSKAIIIGALGIMYAYFNNDQNLLLLTTGYTSLAYIVYAMEWTPKK
jgi:hypothetical protein